MTFFFIIAAQYNRIATPLFSQVVHTSPAHCHSPNPPIKKKLEDFHISETIEWGYLWVFNVGGWEYTDLLIEFRPGVPAKFVRDVRRRITEDLFHRALSSRLLRLTLQGPLEGREMEQ